mmetsp:Transcript_54486/g.145379  ORF Transcript_54486/g.145379 Transcript_54486/m.145379 type:complete len:304 (+) Transcript_54486:256-1167(+)
MEGDSVPLRFAVERSESQRPSNSALGAHAHPVNRMCSRLCSRRHRGCQARLLQPHVQCDSAVKIAHQPLIGFLPGHAELRILDDTLGQKRCETTVEFPLALPQVQIIIVVAKGVLDFLRGEVQCRKDEDKDEREHGRPHTVRGPAAKYVRRNGHEESQQQPRRRRVREGQGDRDQAQRVLVSVHAAAKLLENRGEQRGGNVQDAVADVIHDHLLEPVFHERGAVSAVHEGRQCLSIKGCDIQQLVLEGAPRSCHTTSVRRHVALRIKTLELAENLCVQETEQPQHHMLQFLHFVRLCCGKTAK